MRVDEVIVQFQVIATGNGYAQVCGYVYDLGGKLLAMLPDATIAVGSDCSAELYAVNLSKIGNAPKADFVEILDKCSKPVNRLRPMKN